MVKVLLCGQVQGQWGAVWARVSKLNASAKGAPFDVLFCIGKIWPFPDEYVSGGKEVPIPTYCLPGLEEDGEQQEMQERVGNASEPVVEVFNKCFCLNRHGVATIAGLKVAFAAGTEGAGEAMDAANEMKELHEEIRKEGDGIDLFLSAQYPTHFTHLVPDANIPEALKTVQTSTTLETLMKDLVPRYHITSAADAEHGGVFYQRLPYVTERSSGQRQVTRLIGLCGVSSAKDKTKKYLYALQLVPSSSQGEAVDIPAGTTQNPYRQYADDEEAKLSNPIAKRPRMQPTQQMPPSGSSPATQFFFDPALAARGQRRADENRKRRAPPVPARSECWFCLATPSVERHLIVSIGQEAYLAMPKGAINQDHVLIIPIAHHAAVSQVSPACKQEMQRFQDALRKCFDQQDKDMIVIDRNVSTIGAAHCHLQVVGIPRSRSSSCRRVFEEEGGKYHVALTELQPDQTLEDAAKDKSYFYAEIPDGQGKIVRLLHIVDGKHYVQFGRHASACALGLPGRANWKYCVVSKPEEEALTRRFKSTWKPFDFTGDEDDDDDDDK